MACRTHLGRGWFWNKICGWEEYPTSYSNVEEGLHNIRRLDRKLVLWNNVEVGLWKTNFGFLNTRVHQENTTEIKVWDARKTSDVAVSRSPNQVWQKSTRSNPRRHVKRIISGRHYKDPAGGRKHPVLCKSGGFNSINLTINDRKWTSQGNRSYYQNNGTIIGLHGIKPRWNDAIFSIGYDPQHSFRCVVTVSKECEE